jgi:DNA repair exonuclease SbcCD ATPase subunit
MSSEDTLHFLTTITQENTKILAEVRDRVVRVESNLEGLKESTARDKLRTERLEASLREIEKDVHAMKKAEAEKAELWDEIKRLKDKVDGLRSQSAVISAVGGFVTAVLVAAFAAFFRFKMG